MEVPAQLSRQTSDRRARLRVPSSANRARMTARLGSGTPVSPHGGGATSRHEDTRDVGQPRESASSAAAWAVLAVPRQDDPAAPWQGPSPVRPRPEAGAPAIGRRGSHPRSSAALAHRHHAAPALTWDGYDASTGTSPLWTRHFERTTEPVQARDDECARCSPPVECPPPRKETGPTSAALPCHRPRPLTGTPGHQPAPRPTAPSRDRRRSASSLCDMSTPHPCAARSAGGPSGAAALKRSQAARAVEATERSSIGFAIAAGTTASSAPSPRHAHPQGWPHVKDGAQQDPSVARAEIHAKSPRPPAAATFQAPQVAAHDVPQSDVCNPPAGCPSASASPNTPPGPPSRNPLERPPSRRPAPPNAAPDLLRRPTAKLPQAADMPRHAAAHPGPAADTHAPLAADRDPGAATHGLHAVHPGPDAHMYGPQTDHPGQVADMHGPLSVNPGSDANMHGHHAAHPEPADGMHSHAAAQPYQPPRDRPDPASLPGPTNWLPESATPATPRHQSGLCGHWQPGNQRTERAPQVLPRPCDLSIQTSPHSESVQPGYLPICTAHRPYIHGGQGPRRRYKYRFLQRLQIGRRGRDRNVRPGRRQYIVVRTTSMEQVL